MSTFSRQPRRAPSRAYVQQVDAQHGVAAAAGCCARTNALMNVPSTCGGFTRQP
jgi:hypothetical protein